MLALQRIKPQPLLANKLNYCINNNFERDRAISILVELLRGCWNQRWNAISSQMFQFFRQASHEGSYFIFVEIRGRSLVLTWCCGWPWRLDATETPELAELRPNPRSAKCIYDGISLHMYFASTRILKGTEPLAFLLNCFVVVETKGEMQFRAKCVNFFSPSEPWALIIYTQTGSLYVRTFHGIVVEALNFQCLCRGFES